MPDKRNKEGASIDMDNQRVLPEAEKRLEGIITRNLKMMQKWLEGSGEAEVSRPVVRSIIELGDVAKRKMKVMEEKEESLVGVVQPTKAGHLGYSLEIRLPKLARELTGVSEKTPLNVKVDKNKRIILEIADIKRDI